MYGPHAHCFLMKMHVLSMQQRLIPLSTSLVILRSTFVSTHLHFQMSLIPY
jgi:hypothetical protein